MYGSQKIELIGISSKNSCKERLMLYAYTPILVTVEKQNNYNFSLVMHYSLSDKGMVLIPCVCVRVELRIFHSVLKIFQIFTPIQNHSAIRKIIVHFIEWANH